jgi:hypothetical protein
VSYLPGATYDFSAASPDTALLAFLGLQAFNITIELIASAIVRIDFVFIYS